jgi:hypothetical protein
VHKRIIRRLVDAHREGKLLRAAELLTSAGSRVRSFDQAFGPRWVELSGYLRPHRGYWRFEV